MTDRPPKGTRRALRLAGMTASLAGGFARNKVASVFRKGAQRVTAEEAFLREAGLRVAETLGDLKGAAMKVGQMASTASGMLPDEIVHALEGLQRDAPPMDYAVIAEQIEAELGSPPEQLFASFDREPFAAASIGQVHRARTDDGREVVVKVQYPGVGDAVDSDLTGVGRAMKLARLATDPSGLDETLEELRARLHEELDYCREADNLRRFAALHDEDWLVIPQVVGERSSGRILTLTYEPGSSIQDAASWPRDLRNLIGERMTRILLRQLFEFGDIHGDPHPGNFGLRRDGTLVLYDFGCTRAYEAPTLRAFADLARACQTLDVGAADDAMVRLGLRWEKHDPIPPELARTMLRLLGGPLRERPWTFRTERLQDQMVELLPEWLMHGRALRAGKEIAILKRVIAGWHDNLRALDVEVDVVSLIEPWIGAPID